MSTDLDVQTLAEQHPLAHPAVASIRLFDYSTPPGDHLKEVYNALWMAVDDGFPDAPRRIARLMPRGHGKTEGVGVVFPTWAILSHPDLRVAVISKTKGLAAERTEKVVDRVTHHAEAFGVDVADRSRTELTTAANDHKEPTISPYGLESQLTGKHFDVIVWDDIADWENQRTETQRSNVRQYFRDYTRNLPARDSALDGGPVQAVIGTRKHPSDIYDTDILGSPTWDTEVYRAIHPEDWGVVESRVWSIRGTDGETYESVAALPDGVGVAPEGVEPDTDVRVLWPDLQPPEALLYDVVDGDDSLAIWRRENQQDPEALSGEVFTAEMLHYTDPPTTDDGDPLPLTYVAGMDLALIDDPQKAAEQESDYFALAVVGVDPRPDVERAYLTDLYRERGLSVQEAVEWAQDRLTDSRADAVDALLVEQNAGRGVGQRLRDDTEIPARNVSSTGDKHDRIHALSADFQSARLQILGDPTADPWETFETEEWLPFPTAAHDDMLDATELAMRAVGFGSVPTAGISLGGSAATREGPDPGSDGDMIRQAVEQFQERHRTSDKYGKQ